MIIIGCDYHPGFQQIAYVNTDTGELSEARLGHKEQAEQFYRELSKRGVPVRVGMEASGRSLSRRHSDAIRPNVPQDVQLLATSPSVLDTLSPSTRSTSKRR